MDTMHAALDWDASAVRKAGLHPAPGVLAFLVRGVLLSFSDAH